MNANDARKAHKLLDYVSQGRAILDDELKLLRSFLPELPKQKTLEELQHEVYDAWAGADGNDWADDVHGELEAWLAELHQQLKGIKDAPTAVPSLPAGMRLADHAVYGRVITSPKPNRDGVYDLLVPRPKFETGADWDYAHECELTFIDYEPAKPAHPEFLETEADYENAPEGTTIALDDAVTVWLKKFGAWRNTAGDHGVKGVVIALDPRRILRWGWGE